MLQDITLLVVAMSAKKTFQKRVCFIFLNWRGKLTFTCGHYMRVEEVLEKKGVKVTSELII